MKNYISPAVTIIDIQSTTLMVASDSTIDKTTMRNYKGSAIEVSDLKAVQQSIGNTTFTKGQGSDGSGNRSKDNSWSVWDD